MKASWGRSREAKLEVEPVKDSQDIVTVLAEALGKGSFSLHPFGAMCLMLFSFSFQRKQPRRGSWEAPAHVSGGLSSQGSQPAPLFCCPQHLGLTPPEHPLSAAMLNCCSNAHTSCCSAKVLTGALGTAGSS